MYLRKECLLNLSLAKEHISKTWRGYLLFHTIKVRKMFDVEKLNEEFCRGLGWQFVNNHRTFELLFLVDEFHDTAVI